MQIKETKKLKRNTFNSTKRRSIFFKIHLTLQESMV